MFVGLCRYWTLQLVLQYRVQVTRLQWKFESRVQCSQADILLTEKLLFLYIIELQNIYVVL
jgi:hypothetical protein